MRQHCQAGTIIISCLILCYLHHLLPLRKFSLSLSLRKEEYLVLLLLDGNHEPPSFVLAVFFCWGYSRHTEHNNNTTKR